MPLPTKDWRSQQTAVAVVWWMHSTPQIRIATIDRHNKSLTMQKRKMLNNIPNQKRHTHEKKGLPKTWSIIFAKNNGLVEWARCRWIMHPFSALGPDNVWVIFASASLWFAAQINPFVQLVVYLYDIDDGIDYYRLSLMLLNCNFV